jgi:hypothetical protein
VALFSISNLLHFSLGARITSAHARTRELLLSPLMIASALGFASAMSGVRPPDMLFTGMKLLGDAMVPLMLFALGVRLTQLRRRTCRAGCSGASRGRWSASRGLPLAWALGLEGLARAQLILFGALPPAVMQFLLAERYEQEPERVAAMILLGTRWRCVRCRSGCARALTSGAQCARQHPDSQRHDPTDQHRAHQSRPTQRVQALAVRAAPASGSLPARRRVRQASRHSPAARA